MFVSITEEIKLPLLVSSILTVGSTFLGLYDNYSNLSE